VAYETILYEKRDRIAYITLNRPQAMNAMTLKMDSELEEVWADFRDDPEAWVSIITGAGERAFCAGHDLREDAAGDMDLGAAAEFWQPPSFQSILRGIEIWKPVIAAVNGYCLAGGLELALACDLRIASENASFGFPQVQVGLMPGTGGIQLPRLVALAPAMQMLLTGERIDAQEAYRIGLVNNVVPLPDLMAEAEKLARRICDNAPLGVSAVKQAAIRGLSLTLEQGLQLGMQLYNQVRRTEDAKEGPKAFVEKRKPEYRAR
jgi:enoyl-CoA hydratase/carnithine racemase